MSNRADVRTIDLKSHIEALSRIKNVLEIYLFGSRAFNTGCLSSDIDILVYFDSKEGIDNNDLLNVRNAEHALDLFKTHDKTYAESLFNGSHISESNLINALHAKLLWSKEAGYNEEVFNSFRSIDVLENIDFKMSNFCTLPKEESSFYDKYGRNVVFVIMPFRDECNQVYSIIEKVFGAKGFKVTRASDKEFSDDLWRNVQVYLNCCKVAVSLFHYDVANEFNPNVAIETGYMMANPDDKYVCILKDKRLKSLPTDYLGKLYKDYDMTNLKDLEQPLYDWIEDHFE